MSCIICNGTSCGTGTFASLPAFCNIICCVRTEHVVMYLSAILMYMYQEALRYCCF